MRRRPAEFTALNDSAAFVRATHTEQRRALVELFYGQIATLTVERVSFAFEHQRPSAGATCSFGKRACVR